MNTFGFEPSDVKTGDSSLGCKLGTVYRFGTVFFR